MKKVINENPVIQGEPVDTIFNVGTMLTFIQNCYMATELPERFNEEDHNMGFLLILDCIKHALEYERNRIDEDWTEKNK
ncbi:MAG: hypothetical protein MJA31_02515 [Clostridia bacterium]|nr:hypothetical protein [Clostridia bacterium]